MKAPSPNKGARLRGGRPPPGSRLTPNGWVSDANHRCGRRESYHSDSVFRVSTRPRPFEAPAPRRLTSRAPALRRPADQMLEAATLEALAHLLTAALPEALCIERAGLLLSDPTLLDFAEFTPGV